MIKTRQNKSILYLLAVALMVAIMSIACKNKPTQAVSFSEVEDSTIVVDPTPTPEEGLKPISGITINANENLSQFENFIDDENQAEVTLKDDVSEDEDLVENEKDK